MAPTLESPVPTQIFDRRSDYQVPQDAIYVFGQSSEERSHFTDEWHASQTCQFLQISEIPESLRINVLPQDTEISLRSEAQLEGLFETLQGHPLVIDVTGLSHHVWAPLLQVSLRLNFDVDVAYVEPGEYHFSDVPRAGEIFDLSERIRGISPLPGFARLAREFDRDSIFVPLLGFEGARYQYVMDQVQPLGGTTYPVVGVPGFRPEYPFYAYEGNEPVLKTTWKYVRVATANCPFEMYEVLDELAMRVPGSVLRIAAIGTKPHSIGAILQAIAHPDRIEIIYDHPVRKVGRTEGEYHTLLYHVSSFMRFMSSATH